METNDGAVEHKPHEQELDTKNHKPRLSGTYRRASRRAARRKQGVTDSKEDNILQLRKRKMELQGSKLELEMKRLKVNVYLKRSIF